MSPFYIDASQIGFRIHPNDLIYTQLPWYRLRFQIRSHFEVLGVRISTYEFLGGRNLTHHNHQNSCSTCRLLFSGLGIQEVGESLSLPGTCLQVCIRLSCQGNCEVITQQSSYKLRISWGCRQDNDQQNSSALQEL